jgi:hypothetical protein
MTEHDPNAWLLLALICACILVWVLVFLRMSR